MDNYYIAQSQKMQQKILVQFEQEFLCNYKVILTVSPSVEITSANSYRPCFLLIRRSSAHNLCNCLISIFGISACPYLRAILSPRFINVLLVSSAVGNGTMIHLSSDRTDILILQRSPRYHRRHFPHQQFYRSCRVRRVQQSYLDRYCAQPPYHLHNLARCRRRSPVRS